MPSAFARNAPKRRSSPTAIFRNNEVETTVPLPCTGARARRMTRRMTSFYEYYLRGVGITLPQYSLLACLSDSPQPLTQLAECLEMDRTTLTRSLRPLLERDWVTEVTGQDARLRLLVLTHAGARFRARADKHWSGAQLALESKLGRDFVAKLNAQLEQALLRLKLSLPDEN